MNSIFDREVSKRDRPYTQKETNRSAIGFGAGAAGLFGTSLLASSAQSNLVNANYQDRQARNIHRIGNRITGALGGKTTPYATSAEIKALRSRGGKMAVAAGALGLGSIGLVNHYGRKLSEAEAYDRIKPFAKSAFNGPYVQQDYKANERKNRRLARASDAVALGGAAAFAAGITGIENEGVRGQYRLGKYVNGTPQGKYWGAKRKLVRGANVLGKMPTRAKAGLVLGGQLATLGALPTGVLFRGMAGEERRKQELQRAGVMKSDTRAALSELDAHNRKRGQQYNNASNASLGLGAGALGAGYGTWRAGNRLQSKAVQNLENQALFNNGFTNFYGHKAGKPSASRALALGSGNGGFATNAIHQAKQAKKLKRAGSRIALASVPAAALGGVLRAKGEGEYDKIAQRQRIIINYRNPWNTEYDSRALNRGYR